MVSKLQRYLITLALKFAIAKAKGLLTSQGDDDDDELLPMPDVPDTADPIVSDPEEDLSPVTEEMFSSWALFIMLFLLISALWSSYYLTQRKIRAVHETVLSIFYGMVVGLIIRMTPGHYIQDTVTFNSSYFFNVLLPPIILNSGYELNQVNFFNNMVSILTFAIPGTFISAMVLGIIIYIWTSLGLESIDISLVDALSVGATLSATDPVTILSIFNAYKVDPKLYTIIFGESLLNDAISIVMFETCQKFRGHPAGFSSFFAGVGLFMITFSVSLVIGVFIGILVALILKHSRVRRYPQIESCLVLLIAYESYFFSNGCHMSGIVSLLFCGITLKHYAYYNMSRRTQITIKYIFQLLARLSENFIFIYLGLELFTEMELVYKPLLIIVTAISICVARWCAVFPLSRFVNWIYRMKAIRATRRDLRSSVAIPDEIPYNYQMMLFWAGLRGAVGVALALGIQGEYKFTLLATVLVVVVLTVIVFGGTTASMLEMMNIKTGCIDENDDSDDEFDIEAVRPSVMYNANDIARDPYSDDQMDSPQFSSNNLAGDSSNKNNNIIETAGMNDPYNNQSHVMLPGEVDEVNNGSRIEFGSSPTQSGTATPTNNNKSRIEIERENLRNKFNGIFRSDSQWFQTFDDNVLKPVFLDNADAPPGQTATNPPSVLGSRRQLR
ncbi:endosomal/prevacuolar sodium/hydrogen exchanger [Monosporozyma unispora]|nr:monovalent cation:H+ antiporter, CPA1 (nhx1) [Kazachstania unispora]